MRTSHKIALVITLLWSSLTANAQVHLVIDTLFNFPDTAVFFQNNPVAVIVRNSGPTPFQGTLQIGIQTSNPVGSIGYLYFNNTPISILSNDTVFLQSSNGFTFDSTLFRPGNNVVVVWPIATQIIQIDTFHTSIYMLTTSGIQQLSEVTLSLAPVPAHDILYFQADEKYFIEYVRIYDEAGRRCPVDNQEEGNGQYSILLSGLPAGQYILEARFKNAAPSHARFIKLP